MWWLLTQPLSTMLDHGIPAGSVCGRIEVKGDELLPLGWGWGQGQAKGQIIPMGWSRTYPPGLLPPSPWWGSYIFLWGRAIPRHPKLPQSPPTCPMLNAVALSQLLQPLELLARRHFSLQQSLGHCAPQQQTAKGSALSSHCPKHPVPGLSLGTCSSSR